MGICNICGTPQTMTTYCVNDGKGGCITFGTVFLVPKEVAK